MSFLSISEINQCRPLLLLLHFTLLRISPNHHVFIFKTISKQVLLINLLLEERKVLGLEVREELGYQLFSVELGVFIKNLFDKLVIVLVGVELRTAHEMMMRGMQLCVVLFGLEFLLLLVKHHDFHFILHLRMLLVNIDILRYDVLNATTKIAANCAV